MSDDSLFTGTLAGWTTGSFDHNGNWKHTPLRIEIRPDQDRTPNVWPPERVSVFTPDQLAEHDRRIQEHVWDQAYQQGICDEQVSHDNIGLQEPGMKTPAARINPHRADRTAQ